MSNTHQSSVEEFLAYLTFQKRYSPHTISSYGRDLRDFYDYLQVQYEGDVTLSSFVIKSWLAELKGAKQSSKTINRKISTLKSYCKFLLKKGVITTSPMSTVSSLKISKRLPSYVEEEQIATLFNHVEFADDWRGQTDRLCLQVLYNTGIRVSELVNLLENQVDYGNMSIKVLGKGNKERIIPISPELARDIREYTTRKKSLIEDLSSPELLVNKKGKKLNRSVVYERVKRNLTLVTTNKKKSPHILRHSFATHLTNNGADISAIKELLGHSSLASTQVYTSNTIERLKDIHNKAHPKGGG